MNSVVEQVDENSFATIALANLMITIVGQIITIGWMNVLLRAVRDQELEVGNFFDKANLLIKYFLTSLLTGVVVLVGLILLIVPGIYFALKYTFAGFLVVDKGVGPFQALEMSGQLTKGFKGKLFLYWLGFLGVNLLGLLALILGVFVTIPLTSIASAVLYTVLLEKIAESTAPPLESVTPQSL